MRTKGSIQCLSFGLEFANAVTVEIDENHSAPCLVDCNGPNSVFAVLHMCVPSIVRTDANSNPIKGAISSIEFRKFLAKSGYESCRHRSRVRGTKDKWTKGIKRWKNRRWIDPDNADELAHFKTKLDKLKSCSSRFGSICEIKIVEFLSSRSRIVDLPSDKAKELSTSKLQLCCKKRAVPRVSFTTQCRYCNPMATQTFISMAGVA